MDRLNRDSCCLVILPFGQGICRGGAASLRLSSSWILLAYRLRKTLEDRPQTPPGGRQTHSGAGMGRLARWPRG